MGFLRRSGGGNDIWATPPGGLPSTAARRSLKAPIAFGLAVTLGIGGAVTYSSMKASTAVSADDALAEFQAARESSSGTPAEDRPSEEGRADPEKKARRDRDRRPVKSDGGDKGAVVAAPETQENPSGDGDRPDGAADRPTSRPATRNRVARAPVRPREGVYAWQVDGYEQAPGVRRDLPARSHRVINYEGSSSWVEHHIFSKEKEQWMDLNLHRDGVTVSAVRNRVVMGPVEEDGTVVYNPPAFVARLPNEVGRTWKGSWEGRTSGSYTGRTFDHTTVVIQGEKVEVWASEVVMKMRGELTGSATTRSWYSPKYSMVVKQYQLVDIESGPGNYRSEWTGQVLSVTPQT